MNPEVQQTEYSDVEATKPTLDIANGTEPGKLLPPADDSGQWQQIGAQVVDFFSDLANFVVTFVKDKPLTSVGLFLLASVSVKLTLAVLGALNDLPLVAPTLELIGVGYVIWFTTRYLWKASSRQELIDQIQALKDQILGDNS